MKCRDSASGGLRMFYTPIQPTLRGSLMSRYSNRPRVRAFTTLGTSLDYNSFHLRVGPIPAGVVSSIQRILHSTPFVTGHQFKSDCR